MEKRIGLEPIEGVQARLLPCKDLVGNKGQIEGLPGNPRSIKLGELRKLVQSIRDYPGMVGLRELLVYPHKGKYVVIGGNQRLAALKQLGYSEVPCKVIPEGVSPDVLKAYMLRDNAHFGEWDFDKIAVSSIGRVDLELARVKIPEMDIGEMARESVKRARWHAAAGKSQATAVNEVPADSADADSRTDSADGGSRGDSADAGLNSTGGGCLGGSSLRPRTPSGVVQQGGLFLFGIVQKECGGYCAKRYKGGQGQCDVVCGGRIFPCS